MLVYKFSLTYVLKLFGWGEIFFINNLGLPFNSGSIVIGLLFIGTFYFGLNYTRKNDFKTANTIVLCLMFLFLGFSTWIMLPIRANANVVINENNPSDARSLLAYYNREQYPGVVRLERKKMVLRNMNVMMPQANMLLSIILKMRMFHRILTIWVCFPECGVPSMQKTT